MTIKVGDVRHDGKTFVIVVSLDKECYSLLICYNPGYAYYDDMYAHVALKRQFCVT